MIYEGAKVDPISDIGLKNVLARDGCGCSDNTVRAILARLLAAEAKLRADRDPFADFPRAPLDEGLRFSPREKADEFGAMG